MVGLRAFALGLIAVGSVVSPRAAAAPAAVSPSAPSAGAPATNGASSEPRLTFSVSEAGPDLPWTLRLENVGTAPTLVASDARLLGLTVRVPGRKQPVRCRLPEAPKSARDPVSYVPLAPGAAVTGRFDPRLYCYAAGGQSVLVPGAQITPEFGFPEDRKTTWQRGKRVPKPEVAPFVAGTAAADPARPVAGVKIVQGEVFALGSNYAEWAGARLTSRDDASPEAPLALRMSSGSDASDEGDVTVTVTLRNISAARARVFFRRDLLAFEVSSAEGTTTCVQQPSDFAPSPQSYSQLGPGGSESLTLRLREACPAGTFDVPGLYLVHARFDSFIDGNEWGLDAFVGHLGTRSPAAVRVRRGDVRVKPRQLTVVPAPPSDT